MNITGGEYEDGTFEDDAGGGQVQQAPAPEQIAEYLQTNPEMLDSVIAERQAQAEAAAKWQEAIQEGQEWGDWSKYGQMVAEQQMAETEAKARQSAQAELERAAFGSVVATLDDIAQAHFPEAVATLTEGEMQVLRRDQHPDMTDREWANAVMYTLSERQKELTGSADQGGHVAGQGYDTDDPSLYSPRPSAFSGVSASIRAALQDSE